jgi:HEAT repeat protein
MSKSTALDQMLSKLASIRANPGAPGAVDDLTRALESKTNLIAERAAKIISEHKLAQFSVPLERAFERFLSPGADKGCGAKTAIATTLYESGAVAPDVFLAGIHHIQMEPAWGGSQDVAAELRGVCALGLVRIAHRDALLHVTDLLTDLQPQARIIAARALAYSGRDEAALPLRVKIRSGDREAEVTAECITALMKLAPQKSLDLVAEYLDDPDEMIRESAALALGESRRREAFDVLRDQVERSVDPELRRPLLLAIAVSRLPEAIKYLTDSLAAWDAETAKHALAALHIYRHDDSIRNAVGEAISKRKEASVKKKYEELFG